MFQRVFLSLKWSDSSFCISLFVSLLSVCISISFPFAVFFFLLSCLYCFVPVFYFNCQSVFEFYTYKIQSLWCINRWWDMQNRKKWKYNNSDKPRYRMSHIWTNSFSVFDDSLRKQIYKEKMLQHQGKHQLNINTK
jgi:hypothetical protein